MKKVFHTFSFRQLFLLSPVQLTILSFLCMSLIGGSLLWYTEKDRQVIESQPSQKQVILVTKEISKNGKILEMRQEPKIYILQSAQKGENFIDTLFTAVSALCVTGLISTDFSQFTLVGQIITMILIQMGGLGIIVFTSIFAIAIVQGISEQATFQKIVGNILDTSNNQVRIMIKHVAIYTFIFESIAAVIMGTYLQFFVNPTLISNINPWWWAIFHSISAFNNAGFGLLNSNLANFVTDPIINLTISTLIILGGLGYPVLIGMHVFFRKILFQRNDQTQKELTENMKAVAASPLQIRVALLGTAGLLIIGTIFPFIENTQVTVFAHYNIFQRILIAYFQSVSTRTAGFNTIDVGSLGTATLLLYICFMYIGTNPGGTGGGIKIPTVVVLCGYIKDWFQKPGLPVKILGRNVSKFAVSHAIRLFFFSISVVAIITVTICLLEQHLLSASDPTFNFLKILFEVVSAFGTVGLTMGYHGGVTSFSAILVPASKLLIIITMLIGRLGPLTLLAALPWKKEIEDHELTPDYPDAQKIQIG